MTPPLRPVDVSFVVLAWRSADTIAACLTSLLEQETQVSCEVVCWVNGSGSDESVVRGIPGVRIIVSPVNLGFAGALHAVLPHLLGRDIALVNADAQLAPDWLARTSALLDNDLDGVRTGAVGGALYPWPPGTRTGVARVGVTVDRRTAWTGIEILADGENSARGIDSLSGAAVLLSGAALRDVGWLEPGYFAYYEETDLFSRLRSRGWGLAVEPLAVGWHRTASSLGAGSWRYLWLMHRNRLRFAVRCLPFRELGALLARELPAAVRSLVRGVDFRAGLMRVAAALWLLPHLPELLRQRRLLSADDDPSAYDGRVDVVITTYQQAELVPLALSSVLRQRSRPASITVVDDGSSDGTAEAVGAFARAGVRLLHQQNSGVIAARAAGARLGTAPWIVFLDADDWLEPDYLSRTLRTAGQRTGLVTTAWRWEGERHGTVTLARPTLSSVAVGNRVHSASLMRREAYEQVGGHSEELAGGYEDWDLALAILSGGWTARRVKAPLLHYRALPQGRNRAAAARERQLRDQLRARHPAVYDAPGPVSASIRLRVQVARWRGLTARVRAAFV